MAGRRPRRCEICGRPLPEGEGATLRVFCSERCRLVDLGRWLDGAYVIPGGVADRDPRGAVETPLEDAGAAEPGRAGDGEGGDGDGARH